MDYWRNRGASEDVGPVGRAGLAKQGSLVILALGMPVDADLALLTNQRRRADRSLYRLGGQMPIMFPGEDCRGVVPMSVMETGGCCSVQKGVGAGCR